MPTRVLSVGCWVSRVKPAINHVLKSGRRLLACYVVYAIALGSACAQNPAPSMYDIDPSTAKIDARRDFESGNIRFLAFEGVGIQVIGIGDNLSLVNRYGYQVIRGTSDTPYTTEESDINGSAIAYSRAYNAELVELIRKREGLN